MNSFEAGYISALNDVEELFDAYRATGSTPSQYEIAWWIEKQRDKMDSPIQPEPTEELGNQR